MLTKAEKNWRELFQVDHAYLVKFFLCSSLYVHQGGTEKITATRTVVHAQLAAGGLLLGQTDSNEYCHVGTTAPGIYQWLSPTKTLLNLSIANF